MITMYVDKVLASLGGDVKSEEIKTTIDTQTLNLQTLQDLQRQMVNTQMLQGHNIQVAGNNNQHLPESQVAISTTSPETTTALTPVITSQSSTVPKPPNVKKEEKTHICIDCGKCFGRKDHLTRHHLIHSGITFPCEICNSRFSRKDKVKDHMLKVHHPEKCEKPYNCIHCGKLFGRKDHLRRHSITHIPGRGLTNLTNINSAICTATPPVSSNAVSLATL